MLFLLSDFFNPNSLTKILTKISNYAKENKLDTEDTFISVEMHESKWASKPTEVQKRFDFQD